MARPPETTKRDALGRLAGQSDFTDKQQNFLEIYLTNGCQGTAAAKQAGYANPTQASYNLLRKPHIERAIRERARRELGGLTNLALGVWRAVLTQPPVSAADRKLQAEVAGRVLDRAGLAPYRAEEAESQTGKDLSDLSIEELTAIIDRELARKAGDHAKVIDGQAVEVQDSAQPAAPSIAKLLIPKG